MAITTPSGAPIKFYAYAGTEGAFNGLEKDAKSFYLFINTDKQNKAFLYVGDLQISAELDTSSLSSSINQAIKDSGAIEVIDNTIDKIADSAMAKGKFYFVSDMDGTKSLKFTFDVGQAIELTDFAPISHKSIDDKYGAADASNYGHARSGLDSATDKTFTLSDAYAAAGQTNDIALQGARVTQFSRVDHKHPYPGIAGVMAASQENDKVNAIKSLLGNDTYDFINKGTLEYVRDESSKVKTANERLIALENALYVSKEFLSRTDANDQAVASTVSFAKDVKVNGITSIGTIRSVKQGEAGDPGVIIDADTSITGKLNAGQTKVTGSLEITGTWIAGEGTIGGLTQKGAAQLGVGDMNTAITIIPKSNATPGQEKIIFGVKVEGVSATFSGAISGSSLSVSGALSANGATIHGAITTDAFTVEQIGGAWAVKTDKKIYLDSNNTAYLSGAELNLPKATINSVTATALTATNFTLGGYSLSFTAETPAIGTINARLTTGSNKVLYTEDVSNNNGLVKQAISSYVTNNALAKTVMQAQGALPDAAGWDVNNDTVIPTMKYISTYAAATYQPKGNYQPAGSYITVASIENVYNPTGTNPISGTGVAAAIQTITQNYVPNTRVTGTVGSDTNIPTGAAIVTYVTNRLASFSTKPFAAQTTAPSTNLLWIDTSIGNGAIKYYNGSAWVLVSATWS